MTKNEPTLCWNCKNAVPDRDGEVGCSWSRHFVPVKGWDATPTRIAIKYQSDTHRRNQEFDDSYIVNSCPEYERG